MISNFNETHAGSTLRIHHESSNNDDMIDESSGETNSTTEPLNCTDQFYYDVATHTCRPTCDWIGKNVGTTITSVGTFSAVSSILFGIINIIIGFTIQRDSM